MPLVSLDDVSIAYGHRPLLDHAALQIEPRERVSVIGRNVTGKSTLLKILGGEIAADSGTVWRQPALRTARLEQDVPLSAARPVFEIVAEGHTHHLEEDEAWLREHHVDLILSRLELPPDALIGKHLLEGLKGVAGSAAPVLASGYGAEDALRRP